MFQFIHAADLHLDSPLHGLDQYEGAPVEAIRQATRRALENLVQLAIDEKVAFVVIAGDIYDGDWRDYNTGLFFNKQMTRLHAQEIDVYLISGNHDAQSVISRSLSLPDNVRVFATNRPETHIHEPTRAAIHGQGFATKAVLDDLSLKYPAPLSGHFNLGILHTCAAGLEGHDPYAPCTVDGLRRLGYDYWALGHIHVRQFLSESDPVIAFSGNIQGRHIRETGPKGCLLVRVEQDRPTTTFHPLDVFRWHLCEVDLAHCQNEEDSLREAVNEISAAQEQADGRPLAVRVQLSGATPLHENLLTRRAHWENELRARVTHESREAVWIEKIRFATQSPPAANADWGEGPLEEIRQLIAEITQEAEFQKELASELNPLHKRLPPDVRDALLADFPDASSLLQGPWFEAIRSEAGQMLLGELTPKK